MKPYLIGLTGGIGSGKSTVAGEFARLGAEVVVGDELGKIALEDSPDLLARVRERFGGGPFDNDGKLNRRELAVKVFLLEENVKWLTDLTFPRIYELWKTAVVDSAREVIVFDAALIFEWGIEGEFDLVVVVVADPETVAVRAEKSERFTRAEIKNRLEKQVNYASKAARAGKVFYNDSTLESLKSQVHEFWMNEIMPKVQKRRSS